MHEKLKQDKAKEEPRRITHFALCDRTLGKCWDVFVVHQNPLCCISSHRSSQTQAFSVYQLIHLPSSAQPFVPLETSFFTNLSTTSKFKMGNLDVDGLLALHRGGLNDPCGGPDRTNNAPTIEKDIYFKIQRFLTCQFVPSNVSLGSPRPPDTWNLPLWAPKPVFHHIVVYNALTPVIESCGIIFKLQQPAEFVRASEILGVKEGEKREQHTEMNCFESMKHFLSI
jgi:hypothetical protein